MLANPTSSDWAWPFATNEASRALLDVFRFSALLRAHRSKTISTVGVGVGVRVRVRVRVRVGVGVGVRVRVRG